MRKDLFIEILKNGEKSGKNAKMRMKVIAKFRKINSEKK